MSTVESVKSTVHNRAQNTAFSGRLIVWKRTVRYRNGVSNVTAVIRYLSKSSYSYNMSGFNIFVVWPVHSDLPVVLVVIPWLPYVGHN